MEISTKNTQQILKEQTINNNKIESERKILKGKLQIENSLRK